LRDVQIGRQKAMDEDKRLVAITMLRAVQSSAAHGYFSPYR
jgi:hypothetical protein